MGGCVVCFMGCGHHALLRLKTLVYGENMIKYYGTPLSPVKVFNEALTGRNVLIPFPRPDNLKRAIDKCDKIIIDNGAFSIWRKGGSIDWDIYYNFVLELLDRIEIFFIPDVIDGTEEENDELIKDYIAMNISKGVPIWHVDESLERLERLADTFDYIAIGSAGEYAQLGTPQWHNKMDKAMRVLCDSGGYPKVKIHMLRCLNKRIFTQYPFYSGDSTALAQNHKRDGWENITERVEKYDSPKRYIFKGE